MVGPPPDTLLDAVMIVVVAVVVLLPFGLVGYDILNYRSAPPMECPPGYVLTHESERTPTDICVPGVLPTQRAER